MGVLWLFVVLIVFMFGVLIGFFNGLFVEVVKIDSFIVILGIGIVFYVIVFWYIGGW